MQVPLMFRYAEEKVMSHVRNASERVGSAGVREDEAIS
jgi:hypothetical protein